MTTAQRWLDGKIGDVVAHDIRTRMPREDLAVIAAGMAARAARETGGAVDDDEMLDAVEGLLLRYPAACDCDDDCDACRCTA